MTREDTDRLFELLRIFRPNDPKADDKKLRAAWALVLAPYRVEDVRVAVAQWFRESGYWPDVSDIARRCPAPEQDRETPPEREAPRLSEAARKGLEEVRAWHRGFRARLKRAGLPNVGEAAAQGMTPGEWERTLDRAGFWKDQRDPRRE